MMGYRYRGNRPRGRWGMRGFPWLLFFFFIAFNHSWMGFMISIVLTLLLFALLQFIMAASSNAGNQRTNAMTNHPPQPHEESYQPPYQPYQPYEQGYQQQPVMYQEDGQPDQYPQPQYEQPQVPYPEELPPMEQ